MKMGDDVWFICNHKLMRGVLLRNYKNKSTIKSGYKIYRVNYSHVAKKGVENARTGLGVCGNSASNSRCIREKNRGVQPSERGKEKGDQVLKGVWAL